MLTEFSKHLRVPVVAILVLLSASQSQSMGDRPPKVGAPASDFSLPDLNGHTQRLSDYRGKIVLVNFWATWCKPCTTEMPAMQSGYDKLRAKGLVVLAVNELEDTEKVREHIQTYGHTFQVLMDRDNQVANMYGVFGLPVTVFIDEHGVVREYIQGGLLTEEKIHHVVNQLLAASSQSSALRH